MFTCLRKEKGNWSCVWGYCLWTRSSKMFMQAGLVTLCLRCPHFVCFSSTQSHLVLSCCLEKWCWALCAAHALWASLQSHWSSSSWSGQCTSPTDNPTTHRGWGLRLPAGDPWIHQLHPTDWPIQRLDFAQWSPCSELDSKCQLSENYPCGKINIFFPTNLFLN